MEGFKKSFPIGERGEQLFLKKSNGVLIHGFKEPWDFTFNKFSPYACLND